MLSQVQNFGFAPGEEKVSNFGFDWGGLRCNPTIGGVLFRTKGYIAIYVRIWPNMAIYGNIYGHIWPLARTFSNCKEFLPPGYKLDPYIPKI